MLENTYERIICKTTQILLHIEPFNNNPLEYIYKRIQINPQHLYITFHPQIPTNKIFQ